MNSRSYGDSQLGKLLPVILLHVPVMLLHFVIECVLVGKLHIA